MDLIPYLNFKGDCAAAFELYARVLGGKIAMMQTHGESPAREYAPADWHDKIMHARLEVGERVLMGSDAPPAQYAAPQGISVSINVQSVGEGRRIFAELAEGGKVTMPFEETFWSPGFGMVVDRFGIPWMINSEQP